MPALINTLTVTTYRVTCEECDGWFAAEGASWFRDPDVYREMRARYEIENDGDGMYSRTEAVRLAAAHDARWHPATPCRLCGHQSHLPHFCLKVSRPSGAVCGCS